MYPRVDVCLRGVKLLGFGISKGHLAPISYHVDELDELQPHCHHHRFTEVVYRTNHLVVSSKQGLHQTGLVF